jgi:ParB family chromosome partitioning protein
MDYAELDKIQDIKLRNSVLDKIGTPNFKYELQAAIDRESREANRQIIIAELQKFATQVKDSTGLRYVNWYQPSQKKEIIIPEDADTVKYFFRVSDYSIELFKESEQISNSASNNSANEEKQKEIRERKAALEEITKRAFQLRRAFIMDISNAKAKKNLSVIIEYSLRAMLDDYFNIDYELFTDALGIEVNEDDEWNFDNIAEQVLSQPERHMLLATYLALDSEREDYYDYGGQFCNNETLNTVYDFLEKIGYETSEEERSLRDGTHKLFQSANEDK